jgi:hypothetical protein
MDETVGTWQFGEVGLYLTDGTLFALGALQRPQWKAAFPDRDFNRYNVKIRLILNGAIPKIELVTQTIVAGVIWELPSVDDLPVLLDAQTNVYLCHSKDENGQIKTGKDGNPFPDVVLDTIEPLNSEPLPDALKSPTKKTITERTSDALAGRKDPMTAPNVSWTAFWAFAKSYGINDVKALDKTLKLDTGNLDVAETYALLAEKVGHEVTA